MNRIESIISLLKANTGKPVNNADVAKYAAFNEAVTLETISAMIMLESPLKPALEIMPLEDVVYQMFKSVFGYTETQLDAIKATEAGKAGFQYWVDELKNNGDVVNVNTLAIALLNGAAEADVEKAEANVAAEYEAYIDNGSGTEGETIRLTTGFDEKEGTDGNDTFKAPAYNNSNSFESGDELNGGKGSSDKLVATLGDSSSFAIRAETKSIEEVYFTSQAANTAGDNGDNEVVAKNTVDAELMEGVREWWNDDSRADLTIEDVRSSSNSTTIGMRDTDAGTVDYSVYFDNQYITDAGSGAGDSTLEIRMVNAYSLKEDNNPIGGFETITFSVGEQPITVDVTGLTTYAEVISAIEDKLDAEGITDVTVSAQTDRTVKFSDDIGSYTQGENAGEYTPILISSTGADLLKGTIVIGSDVENYNGLNTMTEEETPDVPSLTQTNVVLDNVGRDSKSGVLEIGAMSQSDYSGSNGIQQFNIDVERSSWLQEIRSTNDSLEVLDIRNIDITKGAHTTKKSANGDLRVDYLEDVRVVDAAKMTGALTLTDVQLTDAVVEKYLELTDTNSNPANDNSVSTSYLDHDNGTFNKGFSYEFGSGNDTMNLTISKSNLAAAGTTTREDFVLEINGGAGNDTITTIIGDGTGTDTNAWYINSTINANLSINAGSGNDTIWTKGAGNFIIDAGSGNDLVYTDNSNAAKDVWVLNTADQANGNDETLINNLVSNTNQTAVAHNVQLTVSFTDNAGGVFTKTVTVQSNDYVTSTLEINQAIKTAIQTDDVLSALVKAEDGPANTLVVSSLVDGANNQFQVDLALPTYQTLSFAQATAFAKANNIAFAITEANWNNGVGTAAWIAASMDDVTLNTVFGDGTTHAYNDGSEAAKATVSASTNVVIAAAATNAGIITITVDGTDYAYSFAAGATTASISNGIANLLAENGITADGVTTAGTVTISTPNGETVTATSNDATATATAAAAAAADIDGADSTAVSDNTVTLGLGNDIIVLGTDGTSNDTLVYTGYNNGNDTVVNFIETGAATGADVLDFTSYLGGAEQTAATTDIALAAGALTDATAYELSFDDTGLTGVTFDTLSAAQVKAALNGSAAATDLDTLVNTIDSDGTANSNYILILENANNLGEYKFFHLASTQADADFETVELIGTIDFGASQDFEGGNIA